MGTMAGWYTRRKNKSEFEAALCEKAERYGKQRILEKLREAVADLCECNEHNGRECAACLVWHRVTGGGS